MTNTPDIKDALMRSLSAVGAIDEARFYADLFTQQAPERFALIVIDPRCLKNPLLDALISNIRILVDLGLCPVLLVGALDADSTSTKFQAQRLSKDLEALSVKTAKLNTASYGLTEDICRHCADQRLPILEHTNANERFGLTALAKTLRPAKIIFLQPSGGISRKGRRVPVINIDKPGAVIDMENLSEGQTRFMTMAQSMAADFDYDMVFVIASPLNLLAELFTTKGSGTLIRRAAKINTHNDLETLDRGALTTSINAAFKKDLQKAFLEREVFRAFIDSQYRGGAIFTRLTGQPYLSKFWVTEAAQGEGLARDIWDEICAHIPVFFWRSRRNNPFNDWYMRHCDGMQVVGVWRVFWIGLPAPDIAGAIDAAAQEDEDFIAR